MKRIMIIMLVLMVVGISVVADENDDKSQACKLKSDDYQVCEINDEGICECTVIPSTKVKDPQGGEV